MDITGLLRAWSHGDSEALERLVPAVEAELRKVARSYLSRHAKRCELETTELLNETFGKLMRGKAVEWRDRVHFYGICARLMRQILVDHARVSLAAKRGGGVRVVQGGNTQSGVAEMRIDLIELDRVLSELAQRAPRQAQVVELRFFGGLTVAETAEALGISAETIARDWRLAKLWLFEELGGGSPAG